MNSASWNGEGDIESIVDENGDPVLLEKSDRPSHASQPTYFVRDCLAFLRQFDKLPRADVLLPQLHYRHSSRAGLL